MNRGGSKRLAKTRSSLAFALSASPANMDENEVAVETSQRSSASLNWLSALNFQTSAKEVTALTSHELAGSLQCALLAT